MHVCHCQLYASKGLKSALNGGKKAPNGDWRAFPGARGESSFHQTLPGVAIRPVPAVQQVGADEGVNIAIENLLNVAALDLGAMVLDELVGLQGVGANLAAKTDFGL